MRAYLTKIGSASVIALAMAVVAPAYAGGKVTGADYGNGKTIFESGKGDVPACNSCHGADGMGDDNMGTPRVAGQVYHFLAKQLHDYANDKREDTTMFVMNTNAKGLSVADRKDVAAYMNSMSKEMGGSDFAALAANGTAVGTRYLGKIIVNEGVIERGIAGCQSCHGFNGRGAEPMYPRIAGQKYVYLVNQMKKWRDGSRTNDPMAQMRKVAQSLTDEDIANAAAFLTSAPLTTMGNDVIPTEHLP